MRAALATLALIATVLSSHPASAQAQSADLDPRVVGLLEQISPERLESILRRLQGFETRNTLSSTDSRDKGIGAARQWIFDELTASGYGRLQVTFDSYQVAKQGDRITRDVELRNVVATLPGRTPRRIYVSGHYDSLARRVTTTGAAASFDFSSSDNYAPGANDDGSGTALTMELARVFAGSGLDFDATIVFVLFAGEEQGLVGSNLHAQKARAEGWPIVAVLNNDIVGNSHGGNGIDDGEGVRVFSEGPEDSTSRQLARYVARQAARYVPSHRVTLIARHDRFGRGGDHTSFNQRGFTAVRITEANENYSRQHAVEDTIDGVSFPYLARNVRVNAAALANLALAPMSPVVVNDRGQPLLDRGASGYDARLRWMPVDGAASYRVFWRRAWSPDWEHEMNVGKATEAVLSNVSIDDYVFGLAAVGSGGHEGLVSAYVNPSRAEGDIKTVPAPPSTPR